MARAQEIIDIDDRSTGHIFTQVPGHQGQPAAREDQVCLVLSRGMFDHSADGCEPLLRHWGGEAIYKSAGGYHLRPHLATIGRPTIVVAHLEVRHVRHTAPPLCRLFVGAFLRLEDVGADVFYKAPISPERIEAIWQPGQPEYDRFRKLPQS